MKGGIQVTIVYRPHCLYGEDSGEYDANNAFLHTVLNGGKGVFIGDSNMSDIDWRLELVRETTSRIY